jgi:hypothetical protein
LSLADCLTSKRGMVGWVNDPFRNMAKLIVLNKPASEVQLKAIADLKAKEDAESEQKKIKEAYEKEQKAYEKEQKRIALEEEKRRAERIKLDGDRQKRDLAKILISNNANIGSKICKNGNLEYSWTRGVVVLGELVYTKAVEKGQMQAFLEGFSQDGYRIKFRISGWATDTGRLRYNPSAPPRLGEFSLQQGAIYWDDVKDWFVCN